MCSLSMCPIGYISWLFTQAQPYVCDEPCVPWIFTQDELCALYRPVRYLMVIYANEAYVYDELCVPMLFTQVELCAPYRWVVYLAVI
jgi:hypothetical protein